MPGPQPTQPHHNAGAAPAFLFLPTARWLSIHRLGMPALPGCLLAAQSMATSRTGWRKELAYHGISAYIECASHNPGYAQELLEHPFLRPTAAAGPPAAAAKPAGSSVELSREQLTKLLRQVAAAGVSGTDVGQLSDQLFQQLSSGLSPDLVSHKAAAAAEARQAAAAAAASAPAAVAAPARPPSQQQQQQQQARVADQPPAGSVAAAAAQAAASRAGQQADAVAALEARRKTATTGAAAGAAAGAGSRAALMPISQSALAQQAAALRKVEPAQKQPAAAAPASGLEAALRKGGLKPC